MFKGQFMATQGVQQEEELIHRQSAQFQRLATDLRTRLDHLLNTSRWAGRFIRSELIQIEPIVPKGKRNLNPFSSPLTLNANDSDHDWLTDLQHHVFTTRTATSELNNDQSKSSDTFNKPPAGTHWLYFRLFFTDVSSKSTSQSVQPGPSASDLYLLLSEELIRSNSGLFSRYGIPQTSLMIAERVPATTLMAHLHNLWQWFKNRGKHWPFQSMFESRTIQQKRSSSSASSPSKMAAIHSSSSSLSSSSSSSINYEFIQSTVPTVAHFSDGSSVYLTSGWPKNQNIPTICAPVHLSFCDHLPYTTTVYPNLLGHQNQSHMESELLAYRQMIDAECDPSARHLLCALLQPPCIDSVVKTDVVTQPPMDRDLQTPPIYSSDTRVEHQQHRVCSQFAQRVMHACSEWTPQAVHEVLQQAIRSPVTAFGAHVLLICSQADSECVAKLRAQGHKRFLCDHVLDCPDASDELFCQPSACQSATPVVPVARVDTYQSDRPLRRAINESLILNRNWFDCGSKCVPTSHRCDQMYQCDNGQDELDCVSFATEPLSSHGITNKVSSGHPKIMYHNQKHLVCGDSFINQTSNSAEMANQLCRLMHFGHADSFAVEPGVTAASSTKYPLIHVHLIDSKLKWTKGNCSSNQILRITCSPAVCGQTRLVHQPPAWVIQHRSWSMESNLVAFSAAHNDWPWFGQLILHDQFLCDVTLVNSYTAIVSTRCLNRWNHSSPSSFLFSTPTSNVSTNSEPEIKSPDASSLAVRFGMIRGGSRQPPARLQAKVQQVRQDHIVSWLHLSTLDCDHLQSEHSRCIRPPLNFVCLPSNSVTNNHNETISTGDHHRHSDTKSFSVSAFQSSACFVVYTDLSEERTLFLAATIVPAHKCHISSAQSSLNNLEHRHLKSHPAKPPISSNSLCVKSIIQHQTSHFESVNHDEAVLQLQQRLTQQPGSPLYCHSATSGWTLVGLMKRPLTSHQQSAHSSELQFEFDRMANHNLNS